MSGRKLQNHAPVAQLDRVTGFEPVGREFESLRACQMKKGSQWLPFLFGMAGELIRTPKFDKLREQFGRP